ncbi:MAG: MSMEG_3727 family PQQ-associated protein [Woeseia sp.]
MPFQLVIRIVLITLVTLLLSGCGMARLMEGMVQTNEPNERMLGQLFAVGGGGKADIGDDGIARIAVEHHPEETVWRPAVILMDRPGDLEILFRNRNPQNHLMIVASSDGGMRALDLPPLQTGRARVHFGTPGMYMFADAMGNHMGRGMMGMVVVGGEVPDEARLDRPPQPRP